MARISLHTEFNKSMPVGRVKKTTNERLRRKSVWLVSFTDVISLMLAFFVLLFSMKEMDQRYWSKISSVLDQERSSVFGAPQEFGVSEFERIQIEAPRARVFTLNYLEALLKTYMDRGTMARPLSYQRQANALIVSWNYSDLNSMIENSDAGLRVLSDSLSRIRNRLEISAKADTGSGTVNMLVSGQKMVSLLKQSGYQGEIAISGLSVSRQRAIFPNDVVGGYDSDRIYLIIFDR